MKQFQAIPVYPLRMRGRFGLTRHIYRHGFWSAFSYTLLYALALILLSALVFSPVAIGLWGHDLSALWDNLKNALHLFFSQLPHSFSWSFQMPKLFSAASGTAFVFNAAASVGLGFLAVAFYLFFLKPRYIGAMYNEMGGRIFGMSGSLSDICKRSGPCLNRYYTTYLAQMLGKIGAKMICSLFLQVLRLFLGAIALFAAVFSVLGGGMLGMGVLLATLFVNLAVESLLLLSYPVAINEESKDFSALGRSVTLVWKNFWRIFGSLLLRNLYVCLWSLPGVILLCIAIFNESFRLPILICGMLLLLLVRLYFIPFKIAFDTVLYQDALAREPKAESAQGVSPDAGAKNTADETASAAHDEPVILLPPAQEGEADTRAQHDDNTAQETKE